MTERPLSDFSDDPQEKTHINPFGHSKRYLEECRRLEMKRVATNLTYAKAPDIYASPQSAAELNALMTAISDEALQANRRLMMKFPFTADQARRMIRIEVNPDIKMSVDQWLWETWHYGGQSPYGRVGPAKLIGFDVYVCRNLPAPGWRVINPMEPQS